MNPAAIDIDNLRFAYPGAMAEHLSIDHWSIAHGARVFLRGASGSGKSTLLHLLAGLRLPDAGTIRINGEDITRLSTAQRDRFRAQHIGIIYQQFNLIPYLSVLDNVLLAPVLAKQYDHDCRQRATDLLQALNLTPSLFTQAAEQLSIGQQQRVAIARALIKRPALLLADEPTSALDQANRDAFLRQLLAICAHEHTTLLFVSHDATLAPLFDQNIALDQLHQAGART
jgi:putative ABC transport system ATP-binding protein